DGDRRLPRPARGSHRGGPRRARHGHGLAAGRGAALAASRDGDRDAARRSPAAAVRDRRGQPGDHRAAAARAVGRARDAAARGGLRYPSHSSYVHARQAMGGFSIWHWLIVLAVVLLIFGTKRLTSGAKDLGSAVKEFKKG